jgi:hypothetical protein
MYFCLIITENSLGILIVMSSAFGHSLNVDFNMKAPCFLDLGK